MDRHVIKGRGENRGLYLCWARMAPETKPTEDGFVWLSKQRTATRWDDPRDCGHTWGTDRAKIHNGYFVKLVAPAAIVAVVAELRAYIAAHASASELLACYWFDGDFHDAGEDFCRDCAEKLVDAKYVAEPGLFEKLYGLECEDVADASERHEAAIDGGFSVDHDSPPHCATCGVKLAGTLTEYGADQEIEALTGQCAPTYSDGEGWAALERALVNVADDDPRWRRIAVVVDDARAAETKAAKRKTRARRKS